MRHRIGKDGASYSGKRGAGILFTDGKKVLLLKRKDGDYKGKWGQPGGKVHPGETDIDAAIRESQEECGNFEGQRIGDFEEKDGIHRWHTFVYKVKRYFPCKLSEEHSAWKWFDLDKLKSVDLHPKFKENLPAYIKMIERKIGFKTFQEWMEQRHPEEVRAYHLGDKVVFAPTLGKIIPTYLSTISTGR